MKRQKLYVLIACEESQTETTAFRELGHEAFSCDLQLCRPGTPPAWHIVGNVLPLLQGGRQFYTQDGMRHRVPRWDLIICHPPCTYLCKVSSVRMYVDGVLQNERYRKMQLAREFFLKCLDAQAPFVAVENPQPMALARLPAPDFFADPSWYGVKYTKKTLYWTKTLPPLMPEVTHPRPTSYVYSSRGKYRSRTFPEMARAIAHQWSEFVLQQLNK